MRPITIVVNFLCNHLLMVFMTLLGQSHPMFNLITVNPNIVSIIPEGREDHFSPRARDTLGVVTSPLLIYLLSEAPLLG